MEKILEKNNLSCAAECMIDQLCEEAHQNAVDHGFYESYDNIIGGFTQAQYEANGKITTYNFILAQLAKTASEIGECVSVIQNDEMDDLPEEMADVCIRLFDLAGFLELKLGNAIIAKMKKNKDRPYLHGKIC